MFIAIIKVQSSILLGDLFPFSHTKNMRKSSQPLIRLIPGIVEKTMYKCLKPPTGIDFKHQQE